MKKSVFLATGLVLTATGLIGPVQSPASAQDDTSDGPPEQSETVAPTMLVLDASGSMKESDPSGGTRMDAAKRALRSVVDRAPEGAELGLMAYGTTPGKVANDLELGCEDINTLREVGPVDADGKKALTSAIDGIDGNGYTPIGASLEAAAEELPAEGPRAVVLVSDGEDTCAPPPPCEVARELKQQGVDLTMHTVGFQVGKKARKELECIAEAGGGSYIDAPDAETLQDELPKIAERALRNYTLAGEPITGTEDTASAPEIGPGQYVDTIDAGQTKYYAIDVPKMFTAHVSATPVIPRGESLATTNRLKTHVRFTDARKVACAEEWETFTDWAPMAPNSIGWTPNSEADCDTDQLYVAVEREGPHETTAWTYDMELQVILEPPVSENPGPEANDAVMPFEKPSGEVRDVRGGGGFNDATELAPESATYAETLHYGEMATYKVKLDWGQALAVRASFGEGTVSEALRAAKGMVNIYAPTRTGDLDWNAWEISSRNEPISLDPIGTTRVLYNNRGTDGEYEKGTAAMAGWYYITVQMAEKEAAGEVDVRLDVNVQGDPIDPPRYAKIGDYPAAPVTEKPEPKPEKGSDADEASEKEKSEQDTDDTTNTSASEQTDSPCRGSWAEPPPWR